MKDHACEENCNNHNCKMLNKIIFELAFGFSKNFLKLCREYDENIIHDEILYVFFNSISYICLEFLNRCNMNFSEENISSLTLDLKNIIIDLVQRNKLNKIVGNAH